LRRGCGDREGGLEGIDGLGAGSEEWAQRLGAGVALGRGMLGGMSGWWEVGCLTRLDFLNSGVFVRVERRRC
jgi:hypothetical protein